jgi:type I restriction enzyme R subunit
VTDSRWCQVQLKVIAIELVQTVRTNVSIDWHVRDQARAHIRRLVKRALRKYGYPPDLQDEAVQLVLQQAEVMAREWAAKDGS